MSDDSRGASIAPGMQELVFSKCELLSTYKMNDWQIKHDPIKEVESHDKIWKQKATEYHDFISLFFSGL